MSDALQDALASGAQLQKEGRLGEALALYEDLERRMPGQPDVAFRIGLALAALGDIARAGGWLDRAVARAPNPLYRFARADLLDRAGRRADALQELERVVDAAPAFAPAWARLGEWRLDARATMQAVEALRRADSLRPAHIPTLNNLALALLRAGDARAAEEAARKVLALDAGHASASATLANALLALGAFTRAEEELQRACALAPHVASLHLLLANTRLNLGRAGAALEAFDRAIALRPPDVAQIESARLLAMHYDDRVEAGALFEAHLAWAARHAPGPPPPRPPRAGSRQKLRIGYVSPRMHESSPGNILAEVLAGHDRERFEIFCYASSDIEDAVTDRMKAAATQWRRAASLDDAALASQMRADAIDIAVDLTGHSPGHRLGTFALRPAPVCVTWLDYFDSTGLRTFDAFITDDWHNPAGDERYYTEPLWRLPRPRFCWRRPAHATAPRVPSGAAFTFGCFTRMAKVSDFTIALWSAVLQAFPASRLILQSPSLENPEEHDVARGRFAGHGVDPARIECRGRNSHAAFLQAHGEVDLMLDTYPYTGCTTTFEALWMGCPVLTLCGGIHSARQSAALLGAAGLECLITRTREDFVAEAVRLANDAAGLAALRSRLRDCVERSPIVDTEGFARDLEAAYLALWSRV